MILKNKLFSFYDDHEKYRLRRIDEILKRINNPNEFFYNYINDKELMQLLLDYSMQTNNYKAALRNFRKIEALGKSNAVEKVAKRAKDVLKERLSKGA